MIDRLRTASIVLAALATSACYASFPGARGADGAGGEGHDEGAPDAAACEVAMEPTGADCTIEEPTVSGLGFPEVGDGSTACPRNEGLEIDAGADAALLKVRGASTFRTHRGMNAVSFATEADGVCSHGLATVKCQAAGAGLYVVGDYDSEELAAMPFTASARLCDQSGIGVLRLDDDARTWGGVTHGSIDVVFPGGRRLLADFSAPNCGTE